MSKLEQAIVAIVEVYEEYAKEDEKKHQLSQKELASMMEAQLNSPEFQGKVDPEYVEKAMSKLDKNHDGEVNFREFSQMVAILAHGMYRTKRGKPMKK